MLLLILRRVLPSAKRVQSREVRGRAEALVVEGSRDDGDHAGTGCQRAGSKRRSGRLEMQVDGWKLHGRY